MSIFLSAYLFMLSSTLWASLSHETASKSLMNTESEWIKELSINFQETYKDNIFPSNANSLGILSIPSGSRAALKNQHH